jgi:chromosome partitioning protein
MKIWSVSNQKGGVGKTTTVVTLGSLLAGWGFRTLLVDMDPHGSLTSYFRLNPDEVKAGVYNLFQDAVARKKPNPASYLHHTAFEGIALLPAATAIATLDRQAGTLDGMGLVVANNLSIVAGEFDYVLIDSPPMLGVLMVNALAACDRLIIPVLSEFLALQGLERMVRTLQMIRRSRKTDINYTILPTLFDRRTREAQESLRQLREKYPRNVWSDVIPVDTKLRDASRAGIPPAQYSPESRAVVAYSRFLESLLHDG